MTEWKSIDKFNTTDNGEYLVLNKHNELFEAYYNGKNWEASDPRGGGGYIVVDVMYFRENIEKPKTDITKNCKITIGDDGSDYTIVIEYEGVCKSSYTIYNDDPKTKLVDVFKELGCQNVIYEEWY